MHRITRLALGVILSLTFVGCGRSAPTPDAKEDYERRIADLEADLEKALIDLAKNAEQSSADVTPTPGSAPTGVEQEPQKKTKGSFTLLLADTSERPDSPQDENEALRQAYKSDLEAFIRDELFVKESAVSEVLENAPLAAYEFIRDYKKDRQNPGVFSRRYYRESNTNFSSWLLLAKIRPEASRWDVRGLARLDIVVVRGAVPDHLATTKDVVVSRMKSDLRAAGIRIMTPEEFGRDFLGLWQDEFPLNYADVYLTIATTDKDEKVLAYAVTLALCRRSFVNDAPWHDVDAVVWVQCRFGCAPASKLPEQLKDRTIQLVDEFITDYWKVNKRPTAKSEPAGGNGQE